MTFSVSIGSFGMPSFVLCNIRQCRKVFGDVPILVSDDASEHSDAIQILCNKEKVDYVGSAQSRGHFAGDLMAFLNGLVHSKVNNADIFLKISQRLLLLDPALKQVIKDKFSDPNIHLVIPGKPSAGMLRADHRGFNRFECLTDVLAMRTNAIDPEWLRKEYIEQVKTGKEHGSTFVELWMSNLIEKHLKANTIILPELTDHVPFTPYRYLRRYQNAPRDYEAAFRANGVEVEGGVQLGAWSKMLTKYSPGPKRL